MKTKKRKKPKSTARASFPDTAWSAICRAGDDPADRKRRLERLSQLYWRPVYTVVRRCHARQDADARDLTQSFFTSILEDGVIEKFDAARGSFRTFLKVALASHVQHVRRTERAARRREKRRPPKRDAPDPGMLFDREWVRTLLDNAVEESRGLLAARGHAHAVELFLGHDYSSRPATYASLARKFGLTAIQVKKELQVARACIREVIRERVREIVATPEDLDDELKFVFGP